VLEGSFTVAHRVLTRVALFPFDRFDNKRRIVRLAVPLLVIHGRKDRVVRFGHGEELYELAATPKMFLAVDDGGHTNLHREAGDRYWQAWRDFTRLIESSRRACGLSGRPGFIRPAPRHAGA
jgi:fermentation-respiration switch protein FrsA (DUF1100 family)